MTSAGAFLSELKRRRVLRVIVYYLLASWLSIQVAATVFPVLELPAWTAKLVVALAAIGLPVVVVLAWVFDLGPQGMSRTDAAHPTPSSEPSWQPLPRERSRVVAALRAWLPRGPSPRTHARDHVGPSIRPAEWQQVQEVLGASLELDPGERPAFVTRAFADRPVLAAETRSLLAAHSGAGILDRPPPDLAPAPDPSPQPGVPAEGFPAHGSTIGRYEILDVIGSGGMGVVYRARDLRLERVVALKFLPPHLAADQRTRERFLAEARAIAALDHPNICIIHEIGETDDGQPFLAMAFYDGETLKHRLEDGALPPQQALDIAIQIAHGLASAHECGIAHRDIKPANLVVTGDGLVRILDFGIAKLTDAGITSQGMTPGTVAYMSPEQARGDDVDVRTDVWSLGVVAYEMLTGERPFLGEHDAVVLNAIQHADPLPIRALHPDVTTLLEEAVMRSLARPREGRYASAWEMARALESARDAAHVVTTPNETPPASLPPEGERRSATIVACSLSGFDVLVGSLVTTELERLVGVIREEAMDVAAGHGGTLNRFAGDELVLLFGVPIAREDDAARAVRSALELHERVRALSETFPAANGPPLRLQTGIDTGRVIVRDHAGEAGDRAYHVTGSAADTAMRLAFQADVDEVWLSPACHHLIAAFFETETRHALAVRGRKRPLVPHRVLRESGVQTRLEAAGKAGLTPYVGRAAELATLRRCLDAAGRAEGQVVSVIGEAGIGKSRLLHEFRGTFGGGVSVLSGRCQAETTGVPYLPFIDILRTALGLADPQPASPRSPGSPATEEMLGRVVARIREIGGELEDFIPLYLHLLSIPSDDFPMPQHLLGDTLRLAIREAIAAVLTLLARRQPCVVLLEDWHWVDEASVTVLKQLSEVASGHRLLVLVTSRPGYGVETGTAGQHTHVALHPLDRSSLIEFLASFLRVHGFPDELGTLLHERTAGNPFFLEEICLALLEEGAIRIEHGEALLTDRLRPLDLPDSIEAVIRARLDRLDGNARDVLRLASVVGREFSRIVLERTVVDGERLPEALEVLKAAGLVQQIQVVPDAMYRFKHVLTQEVAYASLLEHQRRDLHGRVGTRIEQLEQHRIEEHLERLAHHFSRAEEWAKAVEYGMRSAERAGALAQFAESLQILERTQRWLVHLPQGSERRDPFLEIMLRQEKLCETLGLRARQQQIIDELIRLLGPDGDRATLAEVYLRQGDVHTLLRRFDQGEEALQRALRIRRELADELGEQKVLRSLGLLRWHEGRNREALACIADVVAMDRRRNDVVALVGDLASVANVLKTMGEHAEAIVRLEEGIAIADQAIAAGSPLAGDLRVKQAYSLNMLAVLRRDAGDLDRAMEHLDRTERIGEVTRLPVYLPFHHTVAAHIYLHQGKVEKGLARYRTAVEQARKANHVPGLSQTLRILGEVLLSLDRHEAALPCLEEAADLYARLEDHENEARMWTQIAAARQKQEDHAGALAAWSRTRALRKNLGDATGELEALEGLGAAARNHAADPSIALAYYGEAVRLAHALEDRAAEGRLRNTVGILEWSRGDFAQALQHYERAFDIFEELGNTADAGLMLNSICITVKALGRLTDATGRLEDAVTRHRETEQHQLEAHALAALGDISSESGRTAAAVDYYRRSLEIRRDIGDVRGEGWMLYELVRNDAAGEQARDLVVRASEVAEECGDHELATACEALRITV